MTESKTRPPRGCVFYALIISSVVFLLLLAGILVGMRYAKKMATDFTDNQPRPLPVAQLSPEDYQQLQNRIDEFRQAIKRGLPTEPLLLSATELNALINQDPDFEQLRGKVHVIIDGDQLKGQLSVPMDKVNLPMFQGRYLNGDAVFRLGLSNGLLRLTAQEITVKGQPIPEVYMEVIRKQNLVRDLNSEPRASVALDRLESVSVKDGKLVVVPKPPGQ